MSIPIVDSHIHLFPESHLPSLSWYTPGSPLGSQHSVDQYRQATAQTLPTSEQSQPTYLRGFIFLETDRLSSVEESGKNGWTHALDEVSFLARVAAGNPILGEGHRVEDRQICLGIVPWAPVPGGVAALEKYMGLVRERARTDEVWEKISGVRYLVQDKPAGVMLQPGFIEGLKWLGRQGLSFDLGVDARQDHLCKPNLRLPYTSRESIVTHPDFLQWKTQVTAMANYPTTYMKLSGAFSEFSPLSPDTEPDISSLVDRLQPWTDVIFDAFGPERVMFGSDWPVCNVGGGGNQVTWKRWKGVVEGVLDRRGLDYGQRESFWGRVAVNAYRVKL